MTSESTNANLFVALRAGFPDELDRVAIETIESGLVYTWRDLERATAMLANLLDSLDLPPSSRIAVQAEKSVESLLLLPGRAARRPRLPAAQHRLQERRGRLLHRRRRAGGLRLRAEGFHLGLEARLRGRDDLRLHARRRPQRQPARARHPLRRLARARRPPQRRHGGDPLHQRHHRAQQGRDADARQPALERADAEGLLGLAAARGRRRRRADPCAADLSRPRPLRRLARRPARRRAHALARPLRPAPRRRAAAARHRVHGRADALRAPARRADADARGLPPHARLHQRLGAAAARHLRRRSASAPATPSSSATA